MLAYLADRDWGMHDRWNDGWHPWLGLLMMGLVIGAIVLVVVLVVRDRPGAYRPPHVTAPPPGMPPVPPAPTANAEAILAERLARSEITPDDYRAMLAALREGGSSSGGPGGTPA